MERNIINRDFEQFVKKNADQYRMYPSEKVWKGVYSSLHTRRRWYGIGLGLLLLSAVAVTWVMMITPSAKTTLANNQNISATSPTEVKPVSVQQFISSAIQHNNQKETLLTEENTPQLNNNISETIINPSDNLISSFPSITNHFTDIDNPGDVVTINKPESKTTEPLNIAITDQETDNESDLSFISATKKSTENIITKSVGHKDRYPLTIESILNTYHPNAFNKKGKPSLQFYFTPTVSYRKLSENKSLPSTSSFATTTNPINALYNVNSVVTHKPDMGVEFGLSAGYPLSKNLKLIGGLQFNVSRYGIKAYSTYGEIATVALNKAYGVDSIATWTNYRNFSGSNTNWLQNYYFSVSAPIGAEYKLFNSKNAQFGISATLQPSYILGDRAYLITTDYKNYVEIPWLIRRWNLNTSFETFVAYSTGKVKWQVGPQVRYQVFSSFQNKYPVKENLFDFGLKVGIMLNK